MTASEKGGLTLVTALKLNLTFSFVLLKVFGMFFLEHSCSCEREITYGKELPPRERGGYSGRSHC